MGKPLGYAVAWLAATALAVVVGVVAVSTVGASLQGRGPLGTAVPAGVDAAPPQVDPDAPVVRKAVRGEYGAFVVECRGVAAYGVAARPDRPAGWRVVSYEQGPDDDVDAVFSDGRRSFDLEVFCNRGTPTVAEVEENTLPDAD